MQRDKTILFFHSLAASERVVLEEELNLPLGEGAGAGAGWGGLLGGGQEGEAVVSTGGT